VLFKSCKKGLLQSPIPLHSCLYFPLVQYADDTVIVLVAKFEQVQWIQLLLIYIITPTGLKLNFQMSNLIPIHGPEEINPLFLKTLSCHIGTLPFTYIGLPHGLIKWRIENFLPIIPNVGRRFTYCSIFFSTCAIFFSRMV
jgi:hypothetical protein